MDLDQLTEQIKLSTDYQVNRRILREKIQTDLHFAYNGGLFRSTPELIMFASGWPGSEALYLEDTYQNPVHIVDPEVFATLCKDHYQKVMNRWHQEHAELRKLRKI
jgi:hypothetical protein